MKELIAKLEQATEGSRELDYAIRAALDPHGRYLTKWEEQAAAARFTASLDAALTLVPEGWSGRIYLSGTAALWRGAPDLGAVCRSLARNETPREPELKITGSADSGSPALALCIAALKARAQ